MTDPRAPLEHWLAEPPPRDVQEALERLRRGADVTRVAVMPDVHLAADVCVGVGVAERLCEEAPGAYKDIGAVMRAQRALTRVIRRLRPRLAFKGG